jgi:hypothetical protein
MDYKLKVLSVVDQAYSVLPRVHAVTDILNHWGYDYTMKVDPLWFGWPSKLIGFIDLVKNLDESYTHVMLIDAADVVVLAPPDQVMEQWLKFEHPWVYNAEPHIWSPGSFTPEEYPTPECTYRYLNSGASIGERAHILNWYEQWTEGFTKDPDCKKGDQDWVAERFIKYYPIAIKIDINCELFQCMCGSDWLTQIKPGAVYNTETETYPLIIHFNGGTDITASDRRGLWEQLTN